MKKEIGVFKQDFFPTLVYYSYHQDFEKLNNNLIDKIYSLRENDKEGVHLSNSGGWQSQDISEKIEFTPLTNWINDTISIIGDDMLVNNDFKLSNIWANINSKGDYNVKHSHPGAHLSGVYYVKTPSEESEIIFYDPRPANLHYPINHSDTVNEHWSKRYFWETVSFTPEAGKLLIFPGWLEHRVQTNQSSEDRISISFNIIQNN